MIILLIALVILPGNRTSWVSAAPLRADVTPNSFLDDYDAPGGFDSTCSLREAIYTVNFDADYGGCTHSGTWGYDVVNLLHGTYDLSLAVVGDDSIGEGDLDIVDAGSPGPSHVDSILAPPPDITLEGASNGSSINANGIDRVLDIDGSVYVYLDRILIVGGDSLPSDTDPAGGGIRIDVSSMVTIIDSMIYANRTSTKYGAGGGIMNSGMLTISGSYIGDNSTASTSTETTTGAGGGIMNSAIGTVTITDSRISGNHTGANNGNGHSGSGGGIYNSGSMVLNRVTVSENAVGDTSGTYATSDAGDGGGISNNGTLTINTSTISGNSAGDSASSFAGDGGGIYNYAASGILVINHATVSSNHSGLGDHEGEGGGVYNATYLGATATIANSILANNDAQDCSGTITSGDYLLVENTGTCTIAGTVDHNLYGLDPALGPLTDAGVLGLVHPLTIGSPAIDAGPATCMALDERLVLRPKDGDGNGSAICDIGAYEAYKWNFFPIMIRP